MNFRISITKHIIHITIFFSNNIHPSYTHPLSSFSSRTKIFNSFLLYSLYSSHSYASSLISSLWHSLLFPFLHFHHHCISLYYFHEKDGCVFLRSTHGLLGSSRCESASRRRWLSTTCRFLTYSRISVSFFGTGGTSRPVQKEDTHTHTISRNWVRRGLLNNCVQYIHINRISIVLQVKCYMIIVISF